jgi:ATP-binding cassette subfamily F protein 3
VQAKSKEKVLEKLVVKVIDRAEKTVRMRVPLVETRSGPALRCTNLSIGYPEHAVATKINVEIIHGSRVAVVGDNGQGKTTFLRTVAGSLDTQDGTMQWGFGCDIGCYAQHVYSSLPAHYTVKEYLSAEASADATAQTVLEMAGSFLFRGDDVDKEVSVLSGGERARLCMAGLLLGKHTVLILDEPGNHLDVETVESLAEALRRYRGTVIFTSHDRSFLERMATAIVEVREGCVTNYPNDYPAYLYRVKKEIEEGMRDRTGRKPAAKAHVEETEQAKAERKARNRKLFDLRSQLQSVERQMNKYTEKKTQIEAALEAGPNDADAKRLKTEHVAVIEKLAEIEERWLALEQEQEKLGGGEQKESGQ